MGATTLEPPANAPAPRFAERDRVEVVFPPYPRGRVTSEPRWHVSGQWQYDVYFAGSGKTIAWTENRLDAIAEVE